MSFAEILEDVSLENRRRMSAKIPEWSGFEGLHFPTRLCTEQCSSGKAARIKAEIARDLYPEGEIMVADLTGGIGVDSWAFGQTAVKVLHNEMDPALSEAAAHNFRILGAENIRCSSIAVSPDNVSGILEAFSSSRAGCPDAELVCYLDPARRSATGSKVFRISDCTPDILKLLPIIMKHCRHVLVKLSPMADIDLCIRELAQALGANRCRRAHCIGVDGECKELLLCLDREFAGESLISVIDGEFRMSFTRSEELAASAAYPASSELCGGYLFEPGAALAKSGAFKLISERFRLRKIGRSAQLYHSIVKPDGSLKDAGKWFSVKEASDFCNARIKSLGREFPRCEVTARNLPLKSDGLRKKMGTVSGGRIHIFAVGADCTDGPSRLLLITEKI